MTTIVTFLLVAAVLGFVAWPFFVSQPEDGWSEATLSPPERQKAEALAALKEAEFDLRTGKLSETDFAALSEKYRQQALTAIAALDAKSRASKPAKGGGQAGRVAYCPACGGKARPGASFCGACGRSLRGAAA